MAGFNADQGQAFQQTRYLANNPSSNAVDNANNYTGSVIAGGDRNPYAGKNPYLDSMIGSA